MKVIIKGVLHQISFNHVLPRFTRDEKRVWLNPDDCGTYCLIKRDGVVVAQGKSTIHPNDKHNFNKEKGRKVALGIALDNYIQGSWNKLEREAVWDTYHQRSRINVYHELYDGYYKYSMVVGDNIEDVYGYDS